MNYTEDTETCLAVLSGGTVEAEASRFEITETH
jgi:hypothetical protein